jgi:predicted enzyme related to lactoylglutathione lyase
LESPSGDGGALIAFGTDGDLEAEVDRLKQAGVAFSDDISDHPWGRIVPFRDPDGNDLQLYAPPA